MHTRGFCLLSAWLALGLAWAAGPVVSSVTLAQRPGSKLVDIAYDLSAAGPVEVSIRLSTDGGATWAAPSASLSGDLGAGIAAGAGKAVVWDSGADWNGQHTAQLCAEITATDPVYLVIDLAAGSAAASYPVAYLWAIPAGGWTAEHKTTKLVLRLLPSTAPSFTMGSPDGELGHSDFEPQHEVTLTQDFHIGVFEVTQMQWNLVMGNWPSYFNNASVRDARPVEQVSYSDIRGASAGARWPDSGTVDVGSFMGRLRQKTGLTTLDLPTESQWEYACRAGTSTALNNGTDLTSVFRDANLALLGRYTDNGGAGSSQDCGLTNGTAAAGSYLSNAWGLHDMHGNVWEWCLDWCGTYPGTVSDPGGTPSGANRVIRGGSWDYFAEHCRAATRGWNLPDASYCRIGFRLAGGAPQTGSHTVTSGAAAVDSRDYTLEVVSAHGSPTPAVGIHSYAWGTTVICSVIDDSPTHDASCWTGAGSVPASGCTLTTGDIVLVDVAGSSASAITWNWVPTAATVTTLVVSDILAGSAHCGGEVASAGGSAVTRRGVCWNTVGAPTLADSLTSDGDGPGVFHSSLVGLTPDTLYHVRAYATNDAGPAYGAEASFRTLAATPGALVVSHPSLATLAVASTAFDGNPPGTDYAFAIAPAVGGGTWVQPDGSIGATAAWQTVAAWGTRTVTGLCSATPYTFAAKARNGDGVETALGLETPGDIPNQAPLAAAGGPYTVCQGSSLTLDGSGSADPDVACGDSIMVYEWAIGDDGSWEYSGANPALPWSVLSALPVGSATALRLRVTDESGRAGTAATTVTVTGATGWGLWDLTGTYTTSVGANPLTLDLVHDTHGRLTGTGLCRLVATVPAVLVSLVVKGTAKGRDGVLVASLALRGTNAAEAASVSLAFTLSLNAATLKLTGPAAGSIRVSGATALLAETVALDIPTPMDGTWTLAFQLEQEGRTVSGTAWLRLSNGVSYALAAHGRASGANAVLSLVGASAIPASRAIRMWTTVTPQEGGWARLAGLTGEGYGQTLDW